MKTSNPHIPKELDRCLGPRREKTREVFNPISITMVGFVKGKTKTVFRRENNIVI